MKNEARICSRLIEFEERAASLYLGLSRRFAANKDLSLFWLQMSMEEKQHALLLRFCDCQQLIAGLPDRNRVQALAKLLDQIDKRSGCKDLSMDDAFLIAAELEGSEINDVFEGLIKPIQGTWHLMRKKIEALKPDHMQILLRAARRFGVSAPVLARMLEIHQEAAKSA